MIGFGTGGWRAVIGQGFIEKNVRIVAEGLCILAKKMQRTEYPIIIGYDNRFLSREAALWTSEVLGTNGFRVEFINKPVPTPLVMHMVMQKGYDWGIAITASHNPSEYNGVKLFVKEGRDAPVEVTQKLESIIKLLRRKNNYIRFEDLCEKKLIKVIMDPFDDFIDDIISHLDVRSIRERHLKVLVDPMHGSGFYPLNVVLNTTRCYTDAIHSQPDAFFGNKAPAPTEETLNELMVGVKEGNYDVGIALDGDGDRLGIIDKSGRYITANEILVMLYWYLAKYKGFKGPVVRNLATTHMLDVIAADFNEECIEVPIGFKYISSAIDEFQATLGGESSGGLTVRGHIHGKDSIFAASLFIEMLSVVQKSPGEIIDMLEQQYGTFRMVECNLLLSEQEMNDIRQKLIEYKYLPEFEKQIEKVNYIDGCKVYFEDNSFVICRPSGTEPVLRIFAEASSTTEANRYIESFKNFLHI